MCKEHLYAEPVVEGDIRRLDFMDLKASTANQTMKYSTQLELAALKDCR